MVYDGEERLQIFNTEELEATSDQGLIIELLKDMASVPRDWLLSGAQKITDFIPTLSHI